jgi:hypothetical protein
VKENRKECMLLVGKQEGRPRRKWVDNIMIYLGDITWLGVD